jgi:hypothetical protein
MAQTGSKIFAMLLITVFVASGLMAVVSVLSAGPVAGCHGQSHSKSTPQSGYQCCVAGHSSALLPNVCDTFAPIIKNAEAKSLVLVDLGHPTPAIYQTAASPPPYITLRI